MSVERLPMYSVWMSDPKMKPGISDCEKKCLNEKRPQLTDEDLRWGFVYNNQYGLRNNTKLYGSYQIEPVFHPENTKVNKKQIDANNKVVRLKTELLNTQGLRFDSGLQEVCENPMTLTAVEQQALKCNVIPSVIFNPAVGNENQDSGYKGLLGLSLYNRGSETH